MESAGPRSSLAALYNLLTLPRTLIEEEAVLEAFQAAI
jgi:hypothetical protein